MTATKAGKNNLKGWLGTKKEAKPIESKSTQN